MTAVEGVGQITAQVDAVGTALARAPTISADGIPHFLEVNCILTVCRHAYEDVPILDGDGLASDVKLNVAVSGTAYAIEVVLPPGEGGFTSANKMLNPCL